MRLGPLQISGTSTQRLDHDEKTAQNQTHRCCTSGLRQIYQRPGRLRTSCLPQCLRQFLRRRKILRNFRRSPHCKKQHKHRPTNQEDPNIAQKHPTDQCPAVTGIIVPTRQKKDSYQSSKDPKNFSKQHRQQRKIFPCVPDLSIDITGGRTKGTSHGHRRVH